MGSFDDFLIRCAQDCVNGGSMTEFPALELDEWQACLDALDFTARGSLVSDAHVTAQDKIGRALQRPEPTTPREILQLLVLDPSGKTIMSTKEFTLELPAESVEFPLPDGGLVLVKRSRR
jgi:hypothetical protein